MAAKLWKKFEISVATSKSLLLKLKVWNTFFWKLHFKNIDWRISSWTILLHDKFSSFDKFTESSQNIINF